MWGDALGWTRRRSAGWSRSEVGHGGVANGQAARFVLGLCSLGLHSREASRPKAWHVTRLTVTPIASTHDT